MGSCSKQSCFFLLNLILKDPWIIPYQIHDAVHTHDVLKVIWKLQKH